MARPHHNMPLARSHPKHAKLAPVSSKEHSRFSTMYDDMTNAIGVSVRYQQQTISLARRYCLANDPAPSTRNSIVSYFLKILPPHLDFPFRSVGKSPSFSSVCVCVLLTPKACLPFFSSLCLKVPFTKKTPCFLNCCI